MKLKKLILSLLLTVSIFNYANVDIQETGIQEGEIEYYDENQDSDVEYSTEINEDAPSNVSKMNFIKNTLIDIAPTLCVFATVKTIMSLNKPARDLVKKYPTISALLAATFVAEEMLPNSLNAKIALLFEKDLMNFEDKSKETQGKIKTLLAILGFKALAAATTYKMVKKSLLK